MKYKDFEAIHARAQRVIDAQPESLEHSDALDEFDAHAVDDVLALCAQVARMRDAAYRTRRSPKKTLNEDLAWMHEDDAEQKSARDNNATVAFNEDRYRIGKRTGGAGSRRLGKIRKI